MRTYFFTYEELEYLASILIVQGEILDQEEIPWFRFQKKRKKNRLLRELRSILAQIIPVVNEADQNQHNEVLHLALEREKISLIQRVLSMTQTLMHLSNESLTEETEKLLYISHSLQRKFEIVKSED